MANETPVAEGKSESKPESKMMLLIALVLVTLVCAGAGFLGGTQVKRNLTASHDFKHVLSEAKPDPKPAMSLLPLPQVVTNLGGNKSEWIRLETSVLLETADPVSPDLAAQLADDITALVHTLSVKQVSGPSGFQNLREELVERLAVRTSGRVKDLTIQSLVIE